MSPKTTTPPIPENEPTGSWVIRGVPVPLMYRMKVIAALQQKSVRQLLFEIAWDYLGRVEHQKQVPKALLMWGPNQKYFVGSSRTPKPPMLKPLKRQPAKVKRRQKA